MLTDPNMAQRGTYIILMGKKTLHLKIRPMYYHEGKKIGYGINIPDPQHCICTLGPGAGDAFVSQMFEAETKTQIYTEYSLLQLHLVILNRPSGQIRLARGWYQGTIVFFRNLITGYYHKSPNFDHFLNFVIFLEK